MGLIPICCYLRFGRVLVNALRVVRNSRGARLKTGPNKEKDERGGDRRVGGLERECSFLSTHPMEKETSTAPATKGYKKLPFCWTVRARLSGNGCGRGSAVSLQSFLLLGRPCPHLIA